MDFFARVTTGRWPVIAMRSLVAKVDRLGIIQSLTQTNVNDNLLQAGHLHHTLYSNSSIRAGTMSSLILLW
jgi:predicted transcriptional regulator